MIFQEPMTSLNPVFTVGFQIEEVLRLHMGMTGARGAQARDRAAATRSASPSPSGASTMFPSQMSGGQQQRVMIAMAIACEPKLLIADEPTTALDVTIQKQILELIAQLQKKHQMSVLFITHDLAVVGEIADHVIVMRNGEIREQGAGDAGLRGARRTPTRKALLQCRPQLDRRPRAAAGDRGFHERQRRDRRRTSCRSARAACGPTTPSCSSVRNLGKSFYSREGLFGQREFKAVKDVSFDLRQAARRSASSANRARARRRWA